MPSTERVRHQSRQSIVAYVIGAGVGLILRPPLPDPTAANKELLLLLVLLALPPAHVARKIAAAAQRGHIRQAAAAEGAVGLA